MKKKLTTWIALILSLALCLSLLAGCGKEEEKPELKKPVPTKPAPEETEADVYTISSYYNNDELELSLDFYSDGSVYFSTTDDMVEGTYYFSGEDLYMEFDGETVEGYFFDETTISLFDYDGLFYEGDDALYAPGSDTGDLVLGDTEMKEYEQEGLDEIRYRDHVGHVIAVYPDWMTNHEDVLMPGSVLLSDDEDGYVFGINVTDAYWAFDGSDEEFLMQLYNNEISDAFDTIYGTDWQASTVDLVPFNNDATLIRGEANLYNDDYDITVRTHIYRTEHDGEMTDHVVAKVLFAEYGNEDQMQFLRKQVEIATVY